MTSDERVDAAVQGFRASRPFGLDPFQIAACKALAEGSSVLVAAPTGAGKTVVAEFAIYLTMRQPTGRVFYTAPMKALSNQKFNELAREYGAEHVGLLTGDTTINGDARIVVMTTEVLRNMLYADSRGLGDLRFVVMDEVHYLADRFRGAVWEEVIIHLPASVALVSLSATVSNAEEFGAWLQAVRGDTRIIVSEERPVPLDQHVLVNGQLIDLFDTRAGAKASRVNPELLRATRTASRSAYGARGNTGKRGHTRSRYHERQNQRGRDRVDRVALIEELDDENLLPAIFFVFSRVGCDAAVTQCVRAGIRLTTAEEREEIRAIVDERCRTLLDEDLAVLGYWEWLESLERGVAAHHAGLLPAFKEVVEELFQRKLVKVVFATETLALGINMPARTVVLEQLEKFNGEARVPITPGEYTQLTGRAGRRRIDVEGHSVVPWKAGTDPQAIAALASKRSYPLNSSFRPTYNMAVNLIERFGRERARDILESSFAQFQADRAVVDLARKVRQQHESLRGYEKNIECHLGDFREYANLRRRLTNLERQSVMSGTTHAERDARNREIARVRAELRAHPCHDCPERETHARWAERAWKLERETASLTAQIESRTGAIAKLFDRITDTLLDLGYLEKEADGRIIRTKNGDVLARIYGERDLLVAECIRKHAWVDLDAPSMAALAAALVFEPRREDAGLDSRTMPRGTLGAALEKTATIWAQLDDIEEAHRLRRTPPLSAQLCAPVYAWARGAPLDAVLIEADLAAGDFVRWAKQIIDLLDQIAVVTRGKVSTNARAAIDLVRRGVIAYSSVA